MSGPFLQQPGAPRVVVHTWKSLVSTLVLHDKIINGELQAKENKKP